MTDPPFSQLDLISCRSVLKYLVPTLRDRVVPRFHYALKSPGFLVLGAAENVGEDSELFDLVDRSHRIYVKKGTSVRRPAVALADVDRDLSRTAHRMSPTAELAREADRILISRFSPPGVIIDEKFEVVQFRGRTGRFLEAPPGEPTANLFKLARQGLFLELRTAIALAEGERRAIRRRPLQLRLNGAIHHVSVEVIPIAALGGREECYLILFHEVALDGSQPPLTQISDSNQQEFTKLQQESTSTKDYMQSLIDQQDATSEELRTTNEELVSANEELLSANHELALAKNELSSVIEELQKINQESHRRNEELAKLNDDITTLLASTNIPLVMVGSDLRIRRFTAPAKRVMSLLPTDIGRPISDIKPALIVPDLVALIKQVSTTLLPESREVLDRDGRWYELRIHPYRTASHRVDGAVLVMIDIDTRKRNEKLVHSATPN